MPNESLIQQVHDWQGFYSLLGGASATLVGLMFVTVSIGSRIYNEAAEAKVRTFVTPTVNYFSLVLLLSASMNIPTQNTLFLTIEWALAGLVGVRYCLSHLSPLLGFKQEGIMKLRGWLWHLGLPMTATTAVLAAGLSFAFSPTLSLNLAALGIILLVVVGLQNSWNTTLILIARSSAQ